MNSEDFNNFDWSPCCELASRTFGWNSLRPVGAASLPCDAKLVSREFGHMKSETARAKEL
jgi:hypothetical protein